MEFTNQNRYTGDTTVAIDKNGQIIDINSFQREKFYSLEDFYNYVEKNSCFNWYNINSTLSIDYIRLFYPSQYFTSYSYINNLRNHFDTVTPKSKLYRHFILLKTLLNCPYRIHLVRITQNGYHIGTTIKIEHPDLSILSYVEQTFGTDYNISFVEYTVDLFSNNQIGLFNLISQTAFLKWPGKMINLGYDSTAYLNDNRKNRSKSSKVYLKDVNGELSIRLEVGLRSFYFRQKKIVDVKKAALLQAEEVFKHLSFKIFDEAKFARQKTKSPSEADQIKAEYYKMLVKTSLLSVMNEVSDGGAKRIMVTFHKLFKNSHLFFKKTEFNEFFKKMISGRQFL